jgi:hypothetical protein
MVFRCSEITAARAAMATDGGLTFRYAIYIFCYRIVNDCFRLQPPAVVQSMVTVKQPASLPNYGE